MKVVEDDRELYELWKISVVKGHYNADVFGHQDWQWIASWAQERLWPHASVDERQLLLSSEVLHDPANTLFAKILNGGLGDDVREVLLKTLAADSFDEQEIGKRIWPHLQKNEDRRLWMVLIQDRRLRTFLNGFVTESLVEGLRMRWLG